jgi:SAM-dependent methyltransferase/NAD(P)-dependent dehydrogenase (short-subunit alcohol dehydrogenase family)/acyl carrier protein
MDMPFAGDRIDVATGDVLFRRRLDTDSLPFLADHVVLGDTIVPGASHIVMLLAASGAALRDVVFAAPLSLPLAGCNTQILQRDDRIELHADAGGSWTLHATASVVPSPDTPQHFDRAAIIERCTEDIAGPAALHDMLETRGISLGPSFRGITRLFRGTDEALVQVVMPDDVAAVHPAQLDACFQALGATFQGEGSGGAFLPLAVDQAVLYRPFAGPLWAHVQARGSGGGSADVATGDVTLFAEDGALIAAISGLTIKRVSASPSDPSDRWTYQVEWLARDDERVVLAEPSALALLASTARDEMAPREEAGLAEGLERLAAGYAQQALATVPPTSVTPAQQRMYAHLSLMAAGLSVEPEPLAGLLIAQHGERMEVALACRSGRALPAVLRGEADPLAALFGGSDGGSVYADPPFARMLNAMVVAALRGVVDALPAGRPLRVLEIGAGTGAVFAALQDLVPADRIAFTFTDISPAFLDAAKTRFGSGLDRCAPLDIERPPEAQGFADGSFDVVVAANVLHATRDLRDSLRNATRLLAPHGILLLLEAVRRSNWSDLVFGLTPGWWRFGDAALRSAHPLLAIEQWQAVLEERFATVVPVASPGDGDQMLAIARGPKPARETLVWEAPPGLAPLDLADAALQMAQRALAQPAPPALRIITRCAQPVSMTPGGTQFGSMQSGGMQSVDTAPGDMRSGGTHSAGTPSGGMQSAVATPGGMLTGGAHSVDTISLAAEQAVLTGLGRVIAIEHPELDCRLVDLPTGAPVALADRMPRDAREAAWRDGKWYAPRLARLALPHEPSFVTSGTHLVTGGLGGLGLLLATWLLEHGAQQVVLMARSVRPSVELPPHVVVEPGDVARMSDVQRVIGVIGADLRGVFHLAGSLSDAGLLRLTRNDLAEAFASKVDGARNLDAAMGDRQLDAFVLFGSSTGLIGNPGQGAHAAANNFMAAVAQARQQRGLTGLCVDWGAWGEAGTLVRSSVGDRLVAAGAALMAPADALEAMGRAITWGQPRVLVAAIDWPRFLAGYGDAVPEFFASVAVPRRPAVTAARSRGGDRRAATGPSGSDPRSSHAALAAFVAEAAAAVLRAAPGEMPPPDAALNEAGLDSLMALELRKALGDGLDLQLPATLLFNFPSVDALIGHLAPLVGLAEAAPDEPPPPETPTSPPAMAPDEIMASVMRMSEAEMAAVIAREFAMTVPGHG